MSVTSTRSPRVSTDSQSGYTPATAEQTVARFANRHGVQVRLTPGQLQTLATILAGPNGAARSEAYLGLAAAGVALSPKNDDEGRAVLEGLLDTALQVWEGRNITNGIQGHTPQERLASLVHWIRVAAQNGPVNAASTEQIRARALASPILFARDVFEGNVQLSELRPAAPPLRAGAKAGVPVQDIMGHGVPRRRITAANAQAMRLPVDHIPGTKEAWTADGVARRLDHWMRGMGTLNEDRILDLTHGLHIDDRVAIAEAFARIRATRGDSKYKDSAGKPLSGRAALDALYHELQDELDDAIFGTSRDAIVVRAQFNPDNPTGQLQAQDIIMLDMSGMLSKNGAAVQRLLQHLSVEQLRATDIAMRRPPYRKSLREALRDGLRGADERRALFLVDAPRVGGKVPDAYLRAFELREAMRGIGTDENRIFRLLESLNADEIREAAAAFHRLYPNEGRPGGSGQTGDIRASALYHALYGELNDFIGGDRLWLERLALSMRGLRYVPDSHKTPDAQHADELAHREMVARYMAMTFRLSGKTETDEKDVAAVLALVQAQPRRGEARPMNGLPTADEVRLMYQRLGADKRYSEEFGGRNLRIDIERIAEGEVRQLAGITLEGAGFNSPAAAAIRIHNALDRGFLGLRGTREEVVYAILDRSDLAPAEREQFLREVRAEYARRFGHGRADALRRDLRDKLGSEVTLPGGRKIASRALVLEEFGTLTNVERIVYAMHEPGAFGVFGHTDSQALVDTLMQMSSGEKVVAMEQYAEMVGRSFNLASGKNPLVEALRTYRSAEARLATVMLAMPPQDAVDAAVEINLGLMTESDPRVDAWFQKQTGMSQAAWVARNFPDMDPRVAGAQRTGMRGVHQMMQLAGGPEQLAALLQQPPEQIAEALRNLVNDLDSGLPGVLMGWLGPHGAGLRNAVRSYSAALREAGITRAESGQATSEQIARVQARFDEVVQRLRQFEQLKGARAETLANWGTLLTLCATMLAFPEASPLVLAGVGAGTRVAAHVAFGQTDAGNLVRQAALGGTAGLMMYLGGGQLQLPAQASFGERVLAGAAVGAETATIYGAAVRGSTSRNWERGLLPGMGSLIEGAFHDAPVGFVTGGVVAGVVEGIRRGLALLRQGNDGGAQVTEDGPRPGGEGTRPPVEQPGGPGGTGTRPPVAQPGGAGGAGTRPPVGGQSPGGAQPPTGGTPPPGGTAPPPGGTTAPPGSSAPSGSGTGSVAPTSSSSSALTSSGGTVTTPATGTATATATAAGTAQATVSFPVSPALSGQTAAAAGAGWTAPVAGTSMTVAQGLVAVESHAYLHQYRQSGRLPTERQWAELLQQARGSQLAAPVAAPKGRDEQAALLEAMRHDAARHAAGGVEASQQPAAGAARPAAPARGAAAGATASSVARMPARPTHRPRASGAASYAPSAAVPSSTATGHAAAAPEVAAGARARQAQDASLAAVQNHPRLAGTDSAWQRRHLRADAEYLLGLEPGALSAVDYEEIMRRIDARYGNDKRTVKEMVMSDQRLLVTFGLPDNAEEIDGIVGRKTRAAFDNAVLLFGQAKVDSGGREEVRSNLDQYAGVMEQAAQFLGRSAASLRGKSRQELQNFVESYQGWLASSGFYRGGSTGVFDRATMDAHVAATKAAKAAEQEEMAALAEEERVQSAEQRALAEEEKLSQQRGTVSELMPYVTRGTMTQAQVIRLVATLDTLRTKQPEAYELGIRSLLHALGQDTTKIASFAAYASGGSHDVLHRVLATEVVGRLSNDAKVNLMIHLVQAGANLDGLPLEFLDKLDDAGGSSAAAEAARAQVRGASVRRKDIRQVLHDDLSFFWTNSSPEEIARRLQVLPNDEQMLRPLVARMVGDINALSDAGRNRVAAIIQNLSDRNPTLASALVRRVYSERLPGVIWDLRDDFARSLARPRASLNRGVRYDPALQSFDDATLQLLYKELDSGWTTDAEYRLMDHLKELRRSN